MADTYQFKAEVKKLQDIAETERTDFSNALRKNPSDAKLVTLWKRFGDTWNRFGDWQRTQEPIIKAPDVFNPLDLDLMQKWKTPLDEFNNEFAAERDAFVKLGYDSRLGEFSKEPPPPPANVFAKELGKWIAIGGATIVGGWLTVRLVQAGLAHLDTKLQQKLGPKPLEGE